MTDKGSDEESQREFGDEDLSYEGDAMAENAEEMPPEKPAELSDRESESSYDSL